MGKEEQPVKLTRREFLKVAGAALAAGGLLSKCVPRPSEKQTTLTLTEPTRSPLSPGQPTETPAPPEIPTPDLTPTVIPPTETPIPTVESPTIPGEALAVGGGELELKQMSGQQLAELVNAQDKGWKILTDQEGNVNCFLGFVGENKEPLVFLGQGPANYTWNSEVSVWESADKKEGVIPDVILPGAWNEETQSAGPLYPASFAFMYEKDSQYYNAILYSQDSMNKFLEYLKKQGIAEDKLTEELTSRGIELLANGQGLWSLGLPKNYHLAEGQNLTRDPQTGSLIILDQLGRPYLQMLTHWSEVKSKREVENIGEWREIMEGITYYVETEFGEVPITITGDKFILKTESGPQELPFVFTDPEKGPKVLLKHFLMALALNPEISKHYQSLGIPWENEEDVRNYLVSHQGKLDYFVCPTGNPNDPNIPPASLDYIRDENGKIQVFTIDLTKGIIVRFKPYTGAGKEDIRCSRGESGYFGNSFRVRERKLVITLFQAERKKDEGSKLSRAGTLSTGMPSALRALAYTDNFSNNIMVPYPWQGIGCAEDFGLGYYNNDEQVGYWTHLMFLPQGIELPLKMWGD